MATAIVPGIYDSALADEDLGISTEEAFSLTRRLARQGLFVGISSGANLAGALRSRGSAVDAVIVVVFCDGGEKYCPSAVGRGPTRRRADGAVASAGVPTPFARTGRDLSERVLRRAVSAATVS